MKSRKQAAHELEEIAEEIDSLLDRADRLLRETDAEEHDRARHYWLAHMRQALNDDHGYLGRGMHTLQDSIEALAQSRCKHCGDEAPDNADICGDCNAIEQERQGNAIAEQAEIEAEERHAGPPEEDEDPE